MFFLFFTLLVHAQPNCDVYLAQPATLADQLRWVQFAPNLKDRRSRCRRVRHSTRFYSGMFANLSWSELTELADVDPGGCMPPKYLNFLSDALTRHPASFATRQETFLDILTRPDRSGLKNFADEILGIPSRRIWHKEKLKATASPVDQLCGVGHGGSWFSLHQNLLSVIEYAKANGLKQIVDLGCGTGRLGLMLGFLFPDLKFTGIELQTNRVAAAQAAVNRWGLAGHIQITRQDLLDPDQPLPIADLYYMYGPTNDDNVNLKVLERIRKMRRPCHIISSLPRTTSLLERADWAHAVDTQLSNKNTLFLVDPSLKASP